MPVQGLPQSLSALATQVRKRGICFLRGHDPLCAPYNLDIYEVTLSKKEGDKHEEGTKRWQKAIKRQCEEERLAEAAKVAALKEEESFPKKEEPFWTTDVARQEKDRQAARFPGSTR